MLTPHPLDLFLKLWTLFVAFFAPALLFLPLGSFQIDFGMVLLLCFWRFLVYFIDFSWILRQNFKFFWGSFYKFFWKGRNLKTCKIHCKLQCILKVGENKKTWNWAIKRQKNSFKKVWSKIMTFGVNFYSKMVLGGRPGRFQSVPRQLPGSPKASPGSLCDSSLASPGPPCESLGAPWHCLGASKS